MLLCLFDMPYGYYEIVRFISFVVFAYFAFVEYTKDKKNLVFVYGALSLLFQPFFKISLGKGMWNVVDVIVAIFLIVTIFKSEKDKE